MTSPFDTFVLSSEVPVSQQELWDWHNRPGAFERLVPPWEKVALSRHDAIEEGGTAELSVAVGPLRKRWVARYREVDPPAGFVDEQVEGPFSTWIHHHQFEAVDRDKSRLTDQVEYSLPFGAAGQIAAQWVPNRLNRTFRYRHRTTIGDLALHSRYAGRPRASVVIGGASGLVGTTLANLLTSGGHRVTPLVRRRAGQGEISWDPYAGQLNPAELAGAGADAVVILSGASIAGGRWTSKRRKMLRDSRIQTVALAARTIAAMPQPPSTLIAASAMGIYGDRGDQILTEEAGPGDGFLADLGREWEEAAAPARQAGVRVVHARFSLVLTPAGGALGAMLPVFRLGLGGRLGSGSQWMSWISHDDAVGALYHALMTPGINGPVNVAAPEPVPNSEFTKTLAGTLNRPAIAPVPAMALRLALGDLADEGLLASTRLEPRKLVDSGFAFRHPALGPALGHLLGK